MIGLLGGIGPFATARYYEAVVSAVRFRIGASPELAILSLDFDRFTELENRCDPGPCIDYLLDGLQRLAAAGASVAAMTANSSHAHLDRLAVDSPVPLLSIVDPVLNCVQEQGYSRVLLLGIRATVRAGFYQRRLEAVGTEAVVPTSTEQDWIDAIVFSELGRGVVRRDALEPIREIVRRHPADAVMLGCTELPLLVGPDDLHAPVIDTLGLHVDAIADRACEAGQASADG